MVDICEQLFLRILYDFYQQKEIHKDTWHQGALQLKLIIDYVIVRQQSKLKVQDVRSYRGVTFRTNFLVNSQILFPFRAADIRGKEINDVDVVWDCLLYTSRCV